MITILGQHGPGVSDLIVLHLVDVGEMQKIVVNVLGDGSLPGLVVLPGGVDERDDKVLVEKVAQVRPISLGTDDPSELRNSLVFSMKLQDFGGVPGEQLAMVLGGNAGQEQVPTLDLSSRDPSVMGLFGGQPVEDGLELKDARSSQEGRLGVLKRC